MNPIFKRKLRQMMQRCTDAKFWDTMNFIHNRAYQLGRKHAREAMECHPGISKRIVQEVETKADEICQTWDGLREISIDVTDVSALEKQ